MRFALTYLCVIAVLVFSSLPLSMFGLPESGLADNVFGRVPITNYFIVFSFLLFSLSPQKPEHKRGILMYYLNVAVGIWWMLYGYFVNGQAATVPFVSFVCPFIFIIMLVQTSSEQRGRLAKFVHAYIVLNAIIALGEYASQAKLIPTGIDDFVGDNRRSKALMGHALTASCTTGAYIIAVLSNIQSYKKMMWPILSIAVCLLAMATYGGRTATVSMVLCSILVLFKGDWTLSADGYKRQGRIIGAILALCLFTALIAAGAYAGLFDVFLDRVNDDRGSGQTRLIAWNAVKSSSFEQLMFGREDKYIVFWDSTFNRVASMAPESFWLNLLFFNGLIVLMPVALIFLIGLKQLDRDVSGKAGYVLLHFFVCISGAVGLGGKSHIMALIMTIVIALCNKPREVTQKKAAERLVAKLQ